MTTNTKEDIEFMIKWFSGTLALAAQGRTYEPTERNDAIRDEIITCIRSTLIKKRRK